MNSGSSFVVPLRQTLAQVTQIHAQLRYKCVAHKMWAKELATVDLARFTV